ncbi:MAG TPA: NAD-dependent epimerase [Myxococcales bacterium]|nr:NAD-dependent epimerase [Myxococcales bacterium]HAN31357.1 NAD-dependent epimerase [Myxococcales bacterium]
MRDQVALVTGGAGLVGSHICDLLLAEGISELRVLDDFSRGTMANLRDAMAVAGDRLQIIRGDIRNQATVDQAVAGCDLVFHQAAIRITRCAQEPREAFDVLATGTLNILDACVKHDVKKLVAASSASVYGPADVFPTDEQHHLFNNRTMYGACKVANEQMMRAYNEMYGLPFVALRYFNVYGPRMDVYGVYTEVLVRWLDRLDAGDAPLIYGTGDQTMDFVFIGDIARANLLAAKADVADAYYNVARGEETSLKELCASLCRAHGSADASPDFIPLPSERRGVEVVRRLAVTDNASRDLNFQAEVGLDDGLMRFVRWRAAELARVKAEQEGS